MGIATPEEFERIAAWGPWATFTPTWSTSSSPQPSLGAGGAIYGRYRRAGTTGEYRGAIQINTATTFGTGEWRISLPPGWTVSNGIATIGYQGGDGLCVPDGGAARALLAWGQPGTTYLRLVTNAGTPASVTSTSPATWTASAANWLSWHVKSLELEPVAL